RRLGRLPRFIPARLGRRLPRLLPARLGRRLGFLLALVPSRLVVLGHLLAHSLLHLLPKLRHGGLEGLRNLLLERPAEVLETLRRSFFRLRRLLAATADCLR